MQLADATAVVTGAAGGIGAAVAAALLDGGARVMASDLDAGRLHDTAEKLADEFPGRVAYRAADATSQSDIEAVIEASDAQFGSVDMWVANAGVFSGFGLAANDEAWAASWNVNVMAHVRAARALVPRWVAGDGGCFATTASAAGLLTQLGSPTYSATKHAALGFAEWLAATYGDRGVQVACLCPMGVDTAMIGSSETAAQDADAYVGRAAVTSAGDVLDPATVAGALVDAIESGTFLALPHAEVGRMYANKAADPDRWLSGMQRFRQSLEKQGLEKLGPEKQYPH